VAPMSIDTDAIDRSCGECLTTATATDQAPPNGSLAPYVTPSATTGHGRLAYRFVVGVDIERFSALSALEQVNAQHDLGQILDTAAGRADLDREAWHRQVAGDGELAVLPNDADGLRLVGRFPNELAHALSETNRNRPDPETRVRVRLAIHHGTLVSGCFGPVGKAPIVASRLLDSEALRHELLRRTETDLAVIISASIYSDIVETRLDGLEPSDFRPVNIEAKGASYAAYLHRGRLARCSPMWATQSPA
jgi:class 3 adenylate cyclase